MAPRRTPVHIIFILRLSQDFLLLCCQAIEAKLFCQWVDSTEDIDFIYKASLLSSSPFSHKYRVIALLFTISDLHINKWLDIPVVSNLSDCIQILVNYFLYR